MSAAILVGLIANGVPGMDSAESWLAKPPPLQIAYVSGITSRWFGDRT